MARSYSFLLIFYLIGHAIVFVPNCEGASNHLLTISAVILSNNNCLFTKATSLLDFGVLDPGLPVDVTKTISVTFDCKGKDKDVSFLISKTDGLYASHLRHTTNFAEYIPYTLTLSPTSGTTQKNTMITLTITGKILGVDYLNAFVDSYSDNVVLTVVP